MGFKNNVTVGMTFALSLYLGACFNAKAETGVAPASPFRVDWFYGADEEICQAIILAARTHLGEPEAKDLTVLPLLSQLPTSEIALPEWKDEELVEDEAFVGEMFYDYAKSNVLPFVIKREQVQNPNDFARATWRVFSREVLGKLSHISNAFQSTELDIDGDGVRESLFRLVQLRSPTPVYQGQGLRYGVYASDSTLPVYSLNADANIYPQLHAKLAVGAQVGTTLILWKGRPYLWRIHYGGRMFDVTSFVHLSDGPYLKSHCSASIIDQ